jgi:hypothetical protein
VVGAAVVVVTTMMMIVGMTMMMAYVYSCSQKTTMVLMEDL